MQAWFNHVVIVCCIEETDLSRATTKWEFVDARKWRRKSDLSAFESHRRRQSRASLVSFTLCGGARLEIAATSLTVQRLNRLSDASTAEV